MLLTIDKVGSVLELFTQSTPEWGVTDAAAALGSPRSSTHALLSSLAEIGLLRNGGQGRYRLGWRITELHETLTATSGLRDHANEAMRGFVLAHRETINLAVLDRKKALLIDKIVSEHPITVRGVPIGTRMPPASTAFGRVLVAFADPGDFPHSHIIDAHGNSFDLREIRSRGFAVDNGEGDPERRCIAAPIRDESDRTIAAVSVTGPASRMTPRADELTAAIRSTADQIGRSISQSRTR